MESKERERESHTHIPEGKAPQSINTDVLGAAGKPMDGNGGTTGLRQGKAGAKMTPEGSDHI